MTLTKDQAAMLLEITDENNGGRGIGMVAHSRRTCPLTEALSAVLRADHIDLVRHLRQNVLITQSIIYGSSALYLNLTPRQADPWAARIG